MNNLSMTPITDFTADMTNQLLIVPNRAAFDNTGNGRDTVFTASYDAGCYVGNVDIAKGFPYYRTTENYSLDSCTQFFNVTGNYNLTGNNFGPAGSSPDISNEGTRSYFLSGDGSFDINGTTSYNLNTSPKALVGTNYSERFTSRFQTLRFDDANVCANNVSTSTSNTSGASGAVPNKYVFDDSLTLCDGTIVTRTGEINLINDRSIDPAFGTSLQLNITVGNDTLTLATGATGNTSSISIAVNGTVITNSTFDIVGDLNLASLF